MIIIFLYSYFVIFAAQWAKYMNCICQNLLIFGWDALRHLPLLTLQFASILTCIRRQSVSELLVKIKYTFARHSIAKICLVYIVRSLINENNLKISSYVSFFVLEFTARPFDQSCLCSKRFGTGCNENICMNEDCNSVITAASFHGLIHQFAFSPWSSTKSSRALRFYYISIKFTKLYTLLLGGTQYEASQSHESQSN